MTEIPLLKDKHIVVGVTGGIAAYKAAGLTSRLVQAGALVDVIMTEAAARFVAPLTYQALTHRPVVTEMFALLAETEIGHVSLGKSADLMVIAPATANTLAKLAHGLADNMLTTTSLACRGPILLAPAMETGMWQNAATQANVALLRDRGFQFIGPEEGRLASADSGTGRMAEPGDIFEACRWLLARKGPLAGKHVLVTAGCTWEPFDPVRFIGNRSSGKMGFALAAAARDQGAEVTLVHGPTALSAGYGVRCRGVQTAQQMHDAVLDEIATADVLLMAAAVGDYRPASFAGQKIKKDRGSRSVELAPNPDILQAVARQKKPGRRLQVVVGFAAETEDLLENARKKLDQKKLDLIVANDVSAPDSGFTVDTNRVTILDPHGDPVTLPMLSKDEVAASIIERVIIKLSVKASKSDKK
ncbi:MAG: bifunctional phosphopantothenoylcysteine decarboxylase/phosphopantothenate--cysteine ligase CoaBC [Desulfobacteraceae bacterium]|jgi:phosphopantothenoylcysteine decarboxylase/phosphopantothenate--cysteine ligase|nr:bifunctional phosphopantothenoylcysteine decarboxylase/phosphopantothenate--cysteine ligase CoaBC [Desulfobacteraceae bacterium]